METDLENVDMTYSGQNGSWDKGVRITERKNSKGFPV